MNLKYPKLKTGLNLVYISIWLGIAGKMLAKAFAYAEEILEVSLISGWVEGIMALIASVVVITGIYIASKEEKRYRIVFFIAIAELVVSFVYGMSAALESLVIVVCFGVISMLIALARFWLICSITAKVLKEEGAETIAKKGNWIGICYSIVYGYSILILLLTLVNAVGILGTWSMLIMVAASVAGWILYVVFLHQATEFFEKLEKDESLSE